jgi:ankyrin repeat protein
MMEAHHCSLPLGHLEVTFLLCEKGADKDKVDEDGRTPLFLASSEGHLEVVHLLCAQGADEDKARNDGCTVLQTASEQGHFDVVRLFHERVNKKRLAEIEKHSSSSTKRRKVG